MLFRTKNELLIATSSLDLWWKACVCNAKTQRSKFGTRSLFKKAVLIEIIQPNKGFGARSLKKRTKISFPEFWAKQVSKSTQN